MTPCLWYFLVTQLSRHTQKTWSTFFAIAHVLFGRLSREMPFDWQLRYSRDFYLFEFTKQLDFFSFSAFYIRWLRFFSLLSFYEPTMFFFLSLVACIFFSFVYFILCYSFVWRRPLIVCESVRCISFGAVCCSPASMCACIKFYPTVTLCSEYSHWMTVHSNNVCMSSQ